MSAVQFRTVPYSSSRSGQVWGRCTVQPSMGRWHCWGVRDGEGDFEFSVEMFNLAGWTGQAGRDLDEGRVGCAKGDDFTGNWQNW